MNIFSHITGRLTSIITLLVICACCVPARAQKVQKGPLELADQYFATGDYYTAAYLYEQYLNPPKTKKPPVSDFPLNVKRKRTATKANPVSRTGILFKQAECYRLAHYWDKAAVSYKQCEEVDNNEYIDAVYWYAVCQRSLGIYADAEQSLQKFLQSATMDNPHMADAQKELETLKYIRRQLARADSNLNHIHKLNMPNSAERGAFAAVQVSGDQYLISSTRTDSVQVNGVNPHHSRLFYATLTDSTLEDITPMPLAVANPLDNQGAGSLSANGNYLYFSQWRNENGQTVSAIYYSVKENGNWSTPVLLSSVNRSGYSSKQPFCSKDGKYLYFASDRPGGSGGFDIWYAPVKEDGTTGDAINAGTNINTNGDEHAPFYHNSTGTLVFSSNGRQGMGGYDLFAAKGKELNWKTPENLGHPFNSSRDDIYFFAREKEALLHGAVIGSDRGTGCCLESYKVSRTPKSKKLSGTLRDCKNNEPVADAVVTLKDASGKTTQVKTNEEGRYTFDPVADMPANMTLTVSRDLYKDMETSVKIDRTDESDLLTDQFISADVCIEKKLVIKPEDVVTVYFEFDRSELRPETIAKLDSIYNVLVEVPAATIQISGYTDGLGTVEYNAKLSDRRARACADYLIAKGVDTSRISFESFGACCPIEMEIINGRDNPDGRSRNRRALINVKKD